MGSGDQVEDGTETFGSVSPEARDYYQESPSRGEGEGLGQRAKDAVEGLLGHGHKHPASQERPSEVEVEGTDAGRTDYVTSNWSEDVGRQPTNADVEDISENYPQ